MGAIYLARKNGSEPLMADSYFEYASTFEESDKITSIILYRYSKGVALALRFLEPIEGMPLQEEIQLEKVSTPITNNSYYHIGYFIAGLLIGAVIAGIAIFYNKREIYK
jgi:predicted S18 family serine protease